MQISRRTLLLGGCAFLAACDEGALVINPTPTPSPSPTPSPTPTPTPTPTPPGARTIEFSFINDLGGWRAGYGDYTEGQEETIDFTSGYRRLPAPLGNKSGYFLSSRNVPDDIFMYITRPVDGLAPETEYRIEVEITFATNAPAECVGIGGAPGTSVFVKAGASTVEPAPIFRNEEERYIGVNVDKGDQSQSGNDVVVIGDFAQPEDGGDCDFSEYQEKTLSTGGEGPRVFTDESGRLWLVIGTESGFEGETAIYYLEGKATLTPV